LAERAFQNFMTARVRFPSPYELKSPPGSEGWRELYPYYPGFPG
jgi:hypothetical protein